MKDPQLGLCDARTRGIWADVICAMYEQANGGELTGTCEQLAQVCRTTAEKMRAAIDELRDTNAATVTERNGKITLVCRRIKRETEAAQDNANRQHRHRKKQRAASITRESHKSNAPSSSSSSSSTSVSIETVSAAAAVSSTEQAPQQQQPAPLARFPQTLETIRSRFPATDDRTASRIVSAALTVQPAITDSTLCQALTSTHDGRQRSAALWIQTVPTFFRNGCPERAGPEDAFDRRLHELLVQEKKHARSR